MNVCVSTTLHVTILHNDGVNDFCRLPNAVRAVKFMLRWAAYIAQMGKPKVYKTFNANFWKAVTWKTMKEIGG
jgi:hypothetical protein